VPVLVVPELVRGGVLILLVLVEPGVAKIIWIVALRVRLEEKRLEDKDGAIVEEEVERDAEVIDVE